MNQPKRLDMLSNLQTRLTLAIVVLTTLIMSARTFALEIAQQYIQNTRMFNISSVVVSILLAGISAYVIIRIFLKNPMDQLNELAEKLTLYDFTHSLDIKVKISEFKKLEAGFNQSIQQINHALREVASNSQELGASSQEIAAACDQLNTNSQEIGNIVEEMAKGNEEQSQNAVEMKGIVEQFIDSVGIISNKINMINEKSRMVRKAGLKGQSVIDTGVETISNANSNVEDALETIKVLETKSKQIDSIIDTITNIAEQTNLLALNAAIEAARAGEHGQGFSVVADEIRQLSMQTRTAVDDVSEMIEEVLSNIFTTVEKISRVEEQSLNAVESMNNTYSIFSDITGEMNNLGDSIEDTFKAAADIKQSSSTAQQAVTEIALASEQSAAGAEEITASVQEQVASIEQVTAAAAQLATMAEELNQLIVKFNI